MHARIAELSRQKDLVKQWLDSLDSTDRMILTMKYIGLSDRVKRSRWWPATWGEITRRVSYSQSQVFRRVSVVLSRISEKDASKLEFLSAIIKLEEFPERAGAIASSF